MRVRTLSHTRILLACSMALIIGLLIGPSAASAATRSILPFGVCSHMLWGYSNSDIDREMDALSAAGAKWLRVDVSWRDIETADGTYNATLLRSLDYVVASATRHGVGVQAVVMETPDWANGQRGMWAPPSDDAKFGEFMRYMAAKYSGRIGYWELGNEVNETDFWNVPRATSPARYTSFLRAGYVGTKAGNAEAKVISAGLAGSDDQYLQQMYDAGAQGYFDLLGVHAYTRGRSPYATDLDTPSSTFDGLAIMKSTMESNGDAEKNIWVTECGWQTSTAGRFVSQDQQAQYVYEAYQRIAQDFPYVETLFVYNLRNNGTDGAASGDNYGLLNRDYSQKPALASYRRAVDTFTPRAVVATTDVTGTTEATDTTEATGATDTTGAPAASGTTDAAGPPAPAAAAGATPVAEAGVKPIVTIKSSKSVVRRSRRVRLSGSVTAALSTRVLIQRKVHGKWKTVRTSRLNRAGRYSLRIKLRARGKYRFRAVSVVPGRTLAGRSRYLRIRVR